MKDPARILVIEDDLPSLQLVTYLLDGAGYATVAAEDGATGLERARRGAFDLVLCDLQLPGLNGFEVLEALAATPDPAAVPVVALTAFSMPSDRVRVLEAGFAGYLTKPIDPENFVAQVEVFLKPGRRAFLLEE